MDWLSQLSWWQLTLIAIAVIWVGTFLYYLYLISKRWAEVRLVSGNSMSVICIGLGVTFFLLPVWLWERFSTKLKHIKL
jgi:hypothetical protein